MNFTYNFLILNLNNKLPIFTNNYYLKNILIKNFKINKIFNKGILINSNFKNFNLINSKFNNFLNNIIEINNLNYYNISNNKINLINSEKKINIKNCQFINCFENENSGGSININSTNSNLRIIYCLFINSSSKKNFGGAISSISLSNDIDFCCFSNCYSKFKGNALILLSSSPYFSNFLSFSTILNCSPFIYSLGEDSISLISGDQRVFQCNFTSNYCNPINSNGAGPSFLSSNNYKMIYNTIFNSSSYSVLSVISLPGGTIELTNFISNIVSLGLIYLKFVFSNTILSCTFQKNQGNILLLLNSSNILLNMNIISGEDTILPGIINFNNIFIEHLNYNICQTEIIKNNNYFQFSNKFLNSIKIFGIGLIIGLIFGLFTCYNDNNEIIINQENQNLEIITILNEEEEN